MTSTTRITVLPHPDLRPQGLSFDGRAGRKLVDELLAQGIAIEHACESSLRLLHLPRAPAPGWAPGGAGR